MRRSDERLGYWLSRVPSSQGGELEPGLISRLLERLGALEPRPAIAEQSLEIRANTIDLQSDFAAEANVHDGLGRLAPQTEMTEPIDSSLSTVREVDLVNSTTIRTLAFPDVRRTRVLGARLLAAPNVRFFPMHLKPGALRVIGNLRTGAVVDGGRLLLAMPAIGGRFLTIAGIPHRRASVNLETLQDAEIREFVQQAQLLKRISPENGEVIAVFRHVPIEMITSLRYAADEQAIIYTTSAEPRRSRTRVHDMAAIRNKVSGEVYLIPRRTYVNLELPMINRE